MSQKALYKPTKKSKPILVTVLKKNLPNENGIKILLKIKLPNGKELEISNHSKDIVLLVPKNKIKQAWKKILQANPKAKIAICYDGAHGTTLVCTKTLDQIHTEIETYETADITIPHGSKTPYERKPVMTECQSTYVAGKQIINIPFEFDRY